MAVVLLYYHHHQLVDIECDDIDGAVSMACTIWEYGDGNPDQIVSISGEVLLDNKAMWKLIDAALEERLNAES